jgi:hypothetical protein
MVAAREIGIRAAVNASWVVGRDSFLGQLIVDPLTKTPVSGLFARDWCWAEMTAKIWILILLLANYVHTVTLAAPLITDY